MYRYLTKTFNKNWFYLASICFVCVLPFSQALVSIFGAVLLFVALVEDSWHNKIQRFKKRNYLLFLPAIFFVYLLSSVVTFDTGNPLYDLKKSLFFLVVPFAFMLGKEMLPHQKRFLLYVFCAAVFVSTLVALIVWWGQSVQPNFGVHKISLVSHIRFSFQLILVWWFLVLFIKSNHQKVNSWAKIGLGSLALYFLAFLIFQQSLTGIIAFIGSVLFFFVSLIFIQNTKWRFLVLLALLVLASLPVLYIVNIVHDFYEIETVDRTTIEKSTNLGNAYYHNFESPMVENGRYVDLYLCEPEMREAWNLRSVVAYDSITKSGYPLSATLKRYLTSKGLRKDAKAVESLNTQDIENVEEGIANIVFQKKKYTLYPRIYQTVWEYYVYTKTGNANYQSFSQRIEFAKAAISIIKDNFWLGVGTGNWKQEFYDTYKNSDSQLNESLYASSHNQYLNYLVKFGALGFLFILFSFIYPIVATRSHQDQLFVLFLVFLFFANFADSNFESHMGSSFFLFFYCFFVYSWQSNYLDINRK